MFDNYVCGICGSKSHEVMDSYKHHWVMCLDCGCIKRFGKTKYLFEYQPFLYIFNLLSNFTNKKNRDRLRGQFLSFKTLEKTDNTYAYYENAVNLDYESTKWKEYDDIFLNFLKDNNINLEGKKVLFISEGPGFIIDRIANICSKLVITEYDQISVDGMKKHFLDKAQILKYDFNSDKLSDVVNEKFDYIFLRSCLTFCNDLQGLAGELNKCTEINGTVFMMFHKGTLGSCLTWMHDEYSINWWFSPESVVRIFSENGFKNIYEITKFKNETNPNKYYRKTLTQKVAYLPFWLLYYAKSLFKNKYFNRQTEEVSYSIFFKKIFS